MNRTRIAFGLLAMIFLAGCYEDDMSVTAQATEPTLSLAGFYSWPTGQAEGVDLETVGRDNIVIVVDRSGSMADRVCEGDGSLSDNTISALQSFIPNIPESTAVGYVDFGSGVEIRVPLGIDNRRSLMDAAANHSSDMGGTNLTDAVEVAYGMLEQQALIQSSTGTYRMVIVTDGAANSGRTLSAALDRVNTTPVEVMTAGFCIGENHILNQPMDTVYVPASNVTQLVTFLTASLQQESPDFILDFQGSSP